MSTTAPASPWFRCRRPRPDARVRLFCFPHAGAGAMAYASWQRSLPEDIEVYAVQLPGREDRADEVAFTSVEPLMDALLPELRQLVEEETFAFYGHSMGALLAFEATRRIKAASGCDPVLLAVSGLPAPDRLSAGSSLHSLPDEELLEQLTRLEGPQAHLDDQEVRSNSLAALRADIAMCENYVYESGPALSCPVSAFAGAGDPSVTGAGLARWGFHAGRGFSTRVFPGSHFFVETARDELLAALAQDLVACCY